MGTTKPPLVANRSNTSQQKQHKNEVTCKFSPRPPFFERGFMPCPGAGANKEAAADGRQPLPSATRRRLLTVGIRPPSRRSREPCRIMERERERERERGREREKDGWLIDVFFILKTHPLHTKVSRKEVERSKGEAFIYYMIINTFSFKGFAPPPPPKNLNKIFSFFFKKKKKKKKK